MTFSWTPHRFAGGALALDVANSVILRADEARRLDRFADAAQLAAFPTAARLHCAERSSFGALVPVRPDAVPAFLEFREIVDRYFRGRALGEPSAPGPARAPTELAALPLADLLDGAARVLRLARDAQGLDYHTVQSALRLQASPQPERLKICSHCGWLFIDRSKNRSRFWCDMAVCGNRAKAARHYRRKKEM
ncbi:CGNR zinc finger domain-containing protein [Rhizobium sp. SSA_523]|uniref:CGNR zinc finger domain-containing protein n=1 Tax=Rhizobium sp. SSA_523 TaxID=2952477 RepID=UPI00209194D2|nr:CGNR zinc finger domain-containing protein [Rhizobium sp. SSA_523]MCO5730747.1 CGNR zinc finger domain-containing protein [Rhizobium sp. SSA_523]WKC24429.1 CGNR zinc finger domain-containing protein [Rhizobium sp. SSA_523]